MRILVAGGAGFIGSVVVPKLADRGYEVDVIDWCWFGNHLPNNIKLIKKNMNHLVVCPVNNYTFPAGFVFRCLDCVQPGLMASNFARARASFSTILPTVAVQMKGRG